MITASEARELGTYESKLASVIDSLEQRIRSAATRSQKMVLMFNLFGPWDVSCLIADVETAFRNNGFDITSQEVVIEDGNRESPRTEFTISWAGE